MAELRSKPHTVKAKRSCARRSKMPDKGDGFNRNILIAVDDSENARRAVEYVGRMLGGAEGFEVRILHIIPEPDDDYFSEEGEREKWLRRRKEKIDRLLRECKQELIDAGFAPEKVTVRSALRYCPSMVKCILAERDKEKYSTIVVGRQGLSRGEEFLFGSISSKIVTHAKNCTVWVVE
jgi:nucleotide-binding universal stress UspA family protein